MKDGDVYHWRWKNEGRHKDCAPYHSYHCYSRIAVAKNGVLYDTYWGHNKRRLDPVQVIARFQGNIHEMTEITGSLAYYRPQDIVDMRHANSSREKVYLKVGAKRDAETMRQHLEYQLKRSADEIIRRQDRIAELKSELAKLDAGLIDEVYLYD